MVGKRAFLQLALGIVIGATVSAGMLALLGGMEGSALHTARWPLRLGGIALLMVVVGLLACVRPTLRAVRIQPVDALKG